MWLQICWGSRPAAGVNPLGSACVADPGLGHQEPQQCQEPAVPGSVWAFRGRRRAGLRTCDICQTALACARSPCAASSGSALLSSHATRATVLGATLPRVVRALLAPRHVLPRTSLPRPPFFPALWPAHHCAPACGVHVQEWRKGQGGQQAAQRGERQPPAADC